MCTVGDLKNNLRILQSEARLMKFNREFDVDGFSRGNPHAYLLIYHHMFTSYNAEFSAEIMELLDDNLFMKSDVRFMEAVYKILRDLFNYKPPMTKEQFFTVNNFVERKIMMCVEVMRMVQYHCRFMGPRNPTNPNIKVTPIVGSRRCSKKSSPEPVVSEPSSISDMGPIHKGRFKPTLGIMGNGWQLKAGYLRPSSDVEEKSWAEWVEDEDARKERSGAVEKSGTRGSGVQDLSPSPSSGRSRPVEVVSASQASSGDKHEKGHQQVMDVQPKARSDWDPTGAVETILAKVRDLPVQLTSFMKAVENRLQKLEDRLERVEGTKHQELQQGCGSELKHQTDSLYARLVLMENRVMLLESKTPSSGPPEGGRVMAAMEEKKAEFSPASFVSLERGDGILPESLVSTFSPIRQDVSDFNPSVNDTLTSLAEGDRRLSSTPNQSVEARPPLHMSGSKAERERGAVASTAESTMVWENLDVSTQQQVERIRDMLKATKVLLPSSAGQEQKDT